MLRLAPYLVMVFVGCRPDPIVSGNSMLNMQPTRPLFVGAFDFDLLDKIEGKACVSTDSSTSLFAAAHMNWTAFPLDGAAPRHGPTTTAISGAISNAIEKLGDADTMVVTRVVTEGSASKLCAQVYGRGVRLKKAKPPTPPVVQPEREKPDEHAESEEE